MLMFTRQVTLVIPIKYGMTQPLDPSHIGISNKRFWHSDGNKHLCAKNKQAKY